MLLSSLKLWARKLGIKDIDQQSPLKETALSSRSSTPPGPALNSENIVLRKYLERQDIPSLPQSQQQLLIQAPKEPFYLKDDASIPITKAENEILIRIDSIGLNPIDWKSPAYGFGLPGLPCVLGRDFVGTVVKSSGVEQVPVDSSVPYRPDFKPGEVVLGVSTDYRDYRKAAFQQYAIASNFNLCHLPSQLQPFVSTLPAIGVAFVAAALSLGVCLGMDFKAISDTPGPDLYKVVHGISRGVLPEDIRDECLDALPENERIRSGDWLAIWGASSTVGFLTIQLAKRAGLKVIAVADLIKHGSKLQEAGADLLVHRANPEEAVAIIRSVTEGKSLRYGIDVVGKETAQLLQSTFESAPVEATTADGLSQGHLVCLVGSPKAVPEQKPSVKYHKLPIKLFHESPETGRALVTWLEDLLFSEHGLIFPEVDVHMSKGLQSINGALERLREGDFTGHRLVVEL